MVQSECCEGMMRRVTDEKLVVLERFAPAIKAADRDFVGFDPKVVNGRLWSVDVIWRGDGGLLHKTVNVYGDSPAAMMVDIIRQALM